MQDTVLTISDLSVQLKNADALFIADLHLSEDAPALTQVFLQLLKAAQRANVQALYILGDWFDAWVGDDWLEDDSGAWLVPIVTVLKQLNSAGMQIYFCHGNRDFGVAAPFLNRFGAKLLPSVSYLAHGGKTYRLEHGDRLCTDDVRYQNFRRIIRFPLVLAFLRRLPLAKRKAIATRLRSKSSRDNRNKPEYIMDVNLSAVSSALKKADVLIHGHTHRPSEHDVAYAYGKVKKRYVLGDWRQTSLQVQAVLGLLTSSTPLGDDFKLVQLVQPVSSLTK